MVRARLQRQVQVRAEPRVVQQAAEAGVDVARVDGAEPETGRGRCRSLSAASIMFGTAAIELVAENPMNIDGYAARTKRSGDRRAMKATLGR